MAWSVLNLWFPLTGPGFDNLRIRNNSSNFTSSLHFFPKLIFCVKWCLSTKLYLRFLEYVLKKGRTQELFQWLGGGEGAQHPFQGLKTCGVHFPNILTYNSQLLKIIFPKFARSWIWKNMNFRGNWMNFFG